MRSSWFHLLILIIILVLGTATFFMVGGNPTAQLATGIMVSVAYMIWGVLHHAIDGDLHLKIVIEYVLVGTIAILFFYFVMRP
ncbi:hypothetical protein HY950_01905 [Candidatus Gottesmanbacteria bacterium]|nr:hypothetical protein [Candidatus Gottesmanbacteria bacterium]